MVDHVFQQNKGGIPGSRFFVAVIGLWLFLATGESPVHAAAVVCRTADGTLISVSRNIERKFLLILQECREGSAAMANDPGSVSSGHTGMDAAAWQSLFRFSGSPEQREMVIRQSGELMVSVTVPFPAPPRHVAGRAEQDLASAVHAVAREYNIDPLLLHAIAHVESRHDPDAISSAGARGIIQVMPATARRFGVADPERELHDPLLNLRVGSAYLKLLQGLFGNNLELVLAAYNAGEGAVIKYGRAVPPYRETQHYVRAVMEHYLKLKKM